MRRNSVICVTFVGICFLIMTGCARSLRQDATNLAKQGGVTANQMGDYYNFLLKDTVDAYRFNTARSYVYQYIMQHKSDIAQHKEAKKVENVLETDTTEDTSETDATAAFDQEGYKQQYDALQKRALFARKWKGTYDAFLLLGSYDMTETVNTHIDELVKTANDVSKSTLNLKNNADVNNAVVSIIKDFTTNLNNIKQNQELLKNNAVTIKLLQDVRNLFAKEAPLYKDIARDRATALTSLQKTLVKNEIVISTGLFGDVLKDKLKLPEPQKPFTDNALKELALGILQADAQPLAQTSANACDALIDSLDTLIILQKKFGQQQTLSLTDSAQQSQTVQQFLDLLRTENSGK